MGTFRSKSPPPHAPCLIGLYNEPTVAALDKAGEGGVWRGCPIEEAGKPKSKKRFYFCVLSYLGRVVE